MCMLLGQHNVSGFSCLYNWECFSAPQNQCLSPNLSSVEIIQFLSEPYTIRVIIISLTFAVYKAFKFSPDKTSSSRFALLSPLLTPIGGFSCTSNSEHCILLLSFST